MLLEAYCTTQSCRRFSTFDLDHLIAAVGAGFLVSDIPEMHCEACNGLMDIKLALVNPNDQGTV